MDLKMFRRQPISQWRTGGLMWGSHMESSENVVLLSFSLVLSNFSLLVLSVLIAPNFLKEVEYMQFSGEEVCFLFTPHP